jgi:hypothetical protein
MSDERTPEGRRVFMTLWVSEKLPGKGPAGGTCADIQINGDAVGLSPHHAGVVIGAARRVLLNMERDAFDRCQTDAHRRELKYAIAWASSPHAVADLDTNP